MHVTHTTPQHRRKRRRHCYTLRRDLGDAGPWSRSQNVPLTHRWRMHWRPPHSTLLELATEED
jgi:hypothetical protein